MSAFSQALVSCMYEVQFVSQSLYCYSVQSSQLLKNGISSVREIEVHCIRSFKATDLQNSKNMGIGEISAEMLCPFES
jgi:hypothetical protein